MINKFLVCSKYNIGIKDSSFGLNLLRKIFNGDPDNDDYTKLKRLALDNIDELALMTLEAFLSNSLLDIIKNDIGFENESLIISRDIMAHIYKMNEETLNTAIAYVYRKLRHPLRCCYLNGRKAPYKLFRLTYDNYHYECLENIFIHEIENIVKDNSQSKSIYLDAVMKRYGITIHNNSYKKRIQTELDYGTEIEELNLSTRSLNALQEHDITCIGELKTLSKEELLSIPNLGSKCVDEIEEHLREYDKSSIQDNSILFQRNTITTIFRYFSDDYEQVTKSIYEHMLEMEFDEVPLFKSDFSPGLINILLMKGYLFVRDVLLDYESIVDFLHFLGYEEYVRELDNFIKCQNEYENLEDVVIIPYTTELEEELSKHNWESSEEILQYSFDNEIEEDSVLEMLISCIRTLYKD